MTQLLTWVSGANRLLAVWSGFATGLMMVAILADVFCRSLLGFSIQGASELAVVMLVTLIFFGLGGAQADKANFNVDILTRLLPVRLNHLLGFIAMLLSALAIGLLCYFSWLKAVASLLEWEVDYGVVPFPIWPARLLIAFGWSTLTLQLALEALDSLGRAAADSRAA
ncbi:TRAP transporter small permease subunit [Ferrovibrio sp.]|uniref:TRAP transporter small permease subunit n=1 Tax=Ferrovibrio sp. TaxID=1917215 RepID=UPI003D0DFC1D